MSGKILVLELLPKMFLTQMTGFFKVIFSEEKLKEQVDFLFADNKH